VNKPLIGVLNAGSSSLKFSFYEGDRAILSGQIAGLGSGGPVATATANGHAIAPPALENINATSASDVLPFLLPWTRTQMRDRKLDALGHRVVHGGMHHDRPQHITPALLTELEALVPLAPLHEPHNIAAIKAVMRINPTVPQVACFDTAFHRSVPNEAQAFALTSDLHDEGVRRYGFHGLSYEYIASALPERAPAIADGRVIVAHLGNGASMCALRAGVSIATTMGFSTLDGLPMGTRCGQVDAGVLLYLLQRKQMSPEDLEDLLYRRSGVLGLSQFSSDFRDLLVCSDPKARFAVRVFCYQAARHIGSLAAALEGLDGVVFTGGVGENAAAVRTAILERCRWLGIELDEEANQLNQPRISSEKSRVGVYVLPTDENLMIARHTLALSTTG
jgi:acetate kinase